MDLASLFPAATVAQVKATIAGFAELGNLLLTAWQSGDPGEQLYQAISLAISYYSGNNAQAIRGFFLDTATDPGDPDPYNPENEALEPAPGKLSALGLSMFFTERPGATLATLSVVFANSSGFNAGPFAPGQFTIALATNAAVTYRNAPMVGVYTGPGGTTSIPAGATSYALDFTAESPVSASNADPNQVVLVTQYTGVTIVSSGAAIGTDRMAPDDYRALCRTQASTTAPNGTVDAYLRWSRFNRDGSPLLRPDLAAVGITKVQSSGSSTTGAVTVYYADGDGAADSTDVTTANANITLNIIGVGDTITFIGLAATSTVVTVTWAVEYQAVYLGKAVASQTIHDAIIAALTARFIFYPIGGFKQTLGAGTITLEEIRGTVKGAHPAISDAALSSPASTTAIAAGHVATLAFGGGSTETAV